MKFLKWMVLALFVGSLFLMLSGCGKKEEAAPLKAPTRRTVNTDENGSGTVPPGTTPAPPPTAGTPPPGTGTPPPTAGTPPPLATGGKAPPPTAGTPPPGGVSNKPKWIQDLESGKIKPGTPPPAASGGGTGK